MLLGQRMSKLLEENSRSFQSQQPTIKVVGYEVLCGTVAQQQYTFLDYSSLKTICKQASKVKGEYFLCNKIAIFLPLTKTSSRSYMHYPAFLPAAKRQGQVELQVEKKQGLMDFDTLKSLFLELFGIILSSFEPV